MIRFYREYSCFFLKLPQAVAQIQNKKKVLAEYALRGMNKPIGISEYELTKALYDQMVVLVEQMLNMNKQLKETNLPQTKTIYSTPGQSYRPTD
jgi:hypothetical protein